MGSAAIDRLAEMANGDAWLVQRGRRLNLTFLLEVGATPYYVRVSGGRIAAVDKAPRLAPSWTFALRAAEVAWASHWTGVPPPGAHDLIAMLKTKRLRIEGELHPFMSHLRYFKDLLALPRRAAGAAR